MDAGGHRSRLAATGWPPAAGAEGHRSHQPPSSDELVSSGRGACVVGAGGTSVVGGGGCGGTSFAVVVGGGSTTGACSVVGAREGVGSSTGGTVNVSIVPTVGRPAPDCTALSADVEVPAAVEADGEMADGKMDVGGLLLSEGEAMSHPPAIMRPAAATNAAAPRLRSTATPPPQVLGDSLEGRLGRRFRYPLQLLRVGRDRLQPRPRCSALRLEVGEQFGGHPHAATVTRRSP